MKLHLGCGEKYLEGYLNIDFPDSEHSVQKPKADLRADIRTLSYPDGTIDEVRSHHLFEHFSRAEALKLLTRWRGWLKPNGRLVIETPDFATSAAHYLASNSTKRRFQLGRHMLGSQEAGWALHKDFWDKPKFRFVLREMGFENMRFWLYSNGLSKHAEQLPKVGKYLKHVPERLRTPALNVVGSMLPDSFYEKYGSNKFPNIVVSATKDGSASIDARAVAHKILSLSLTGKEGEPLLDVWLKEYDAF